SGCGVPRASSNAGSALNIRCVVRKEMLDSSNARVATLAGSLPVKTTRGACTGWDAPGDASELDVAGRLGAQALSTTAASKTLFSANRARACLEPITRLRSPICALNPCREPGGLYQTV